MMIFTTIPTKWNYEVGTKSLPALLYEVIKSNFLRNTFGDELGYIYSSFIENLEFYGDFINRISEDPSSGWWDNQFTPQKETRYDIILESVMDSIKEIRVKLGGKTENWTWGAIHMYYFDHPLGRMKLLDLIFNPKSIPAPGDRDTINKSYFSYISPFNVTQAPSYRFIVDLSDVGKALAMNSTGQSGNPFSGHYSDSVEKWARVNYHQLFFDYKDIKENRWKEQSLIPR